MSHPHDANIVVGAPVSWKFGWVYQMQQLQMASSRGLDFFCMGLGSKRENFTSEYSTRGLKRKLFPMKARSRALLSSHSIG